MKNRLLLVMLGAATGFAAAGRCADVPTNVWVGASGGAFETASNWSNPSLVTDGAAFFAVFTNETTGTGSPFEVTTSTTPVVYGISYAPPTRADDATNVLKLGGFTCRRHESFGNAARLDVGAGACLSIGSKIAAESSAPVEKVGAGTIQFGADEARCSSSRPESSRISPRTAMRPRRFPSDPRPTRSCSGCVRRADARCSLTCGSWASPSPGGATGCA